MEPRKQWENIFKLLKEKKCQPIILYSIKIFFKTVGQVKMFPDKQKLSEFITRRPKLKGIPKDRQKMILEGDMQIQEGMK